MLGDAARIVAFVLATLVFTAVSLGALAVVALAGQVVLDLVRRLSGGLRVRRGDVGPVPRVDRKPVLSMTPKGGNKK